MKKHQRSNLRFRQGALCVALGICFSSGVMAQSNSTGTIFGSVQPGSTVVVQSLDTGASREISVDSNGRYRATALPVGRYKVTLQQNGKVVASQDDVTVLLGTGSEISFGASNQNKNLEVVHVIGSRVPTIDVSATDTRTVFTAQQLANIPVARNINSVALLAPGVVAADSRYGGAASFGGSAASENAIYINGYPVTNPLTNLGSTTLPFDGISQYQAITGGYGAEFGRATGGVINILTKRGSNNFHFGAETTWAPRSLRSNQKSLYYPYNGRPTDGLVYQNLQERQVDQLTYGLYASGPIIKDKLFFYVSGEKTRQSIQTVDPRTSSPSTAYAPMLAPGAMRASGGTIAVACTPLAITALSRSNSAAFANANFGCAARNTIFSGKLISSPAITHQAADAVARTACFTVST